MLTLAEFRRVWAEHDRSIRRAAAALTVSMFLHWALVIAPVLFGLPVSAVCVGLGVYLLTLLVTSFALARAGLRPSWDERLRCPHCRAMLFRHSTPSRTGCCPRCGRPALKGVKPRRPRLWTQAEIEAAVEVARTTPKPWRLLLAWATFIVSVGVLVSSIGLPLGVVLLIDLGLLVLLLTAALSVRSTAFTLPCPHCRVPFSPQQVARGNQCRRCRQPVLADEAPPG